MLDDDSIEVEVTTITLSLAAPSGESSLRTIYRVEKNQLIAISEGLAIGFGGPVSILANLQDQLSNFLDVHSLAK